MDWKRFMRARFQMRLTLMKKENKNMTEHLFQVDINLKKMLFLGNCNFILKWYNVSTKL